MSLFPADMEVILYMRHMDQELSTFHFFFNFLATIFIINSLFKMKNTSGV
jgi:hypothetical protein